jgi:hypothetical protein
MYKVIKKNYVSKVATSAVCGMFERTAAVCCCAGLMIDWTQCAAIERRGWGASGAGLLWLNEAAPSLRSNIPLVATLVQFQLYTSDDAHDQSPKLYSLSSEIL